MKAATLKQSTKILSLFEETPTEQVQSLLESGLLADLRDADIANISRDQFRRVCGLKSLVSTQSNLLLESIGTVNLPATTVRFVVQDWFVVNTKQDAPVEISSLGGNFIKWFLGKTEEPIPETTLRYHKICQSSADGPIITELGGEVQAETTLTALFSLMQKQNHGQAGVLLNNGYASFFYIRDITGTLRAVYVYRLKVGWIVYAISIEYPHKWLAGPRLFSNNS